LSVFNGTTVSLRLTQHVHCSSIIIAIKVSLCPCSTGQQFLFVSHNMFIARLSSSPSRFHCSSLVRHLSLSVFNVTTVSPRLIPAPRKCFSRFCSWSSSFHRVYHSTSHSHSSVSLNHHFILVILNFSSPFTHSTLISALLTLNE